MISHGRLCHTTACHTWHLGGTPWARFVTRDASFTYNFVRHTILVTYPIYRRFARGKRGTNSHPRSFCVAGVALMALGGALGPAWSRVMPRHFAWQAWHLVTSTLISRGRRGTISHPRSFCVAGVALMALGGTLGPAWLRVTPRHCAWQAWHLVTSTLISRGRRGTIAALLRGRRGTW